MMRPIRADRSTADQTVVTPPLCLCNCVIGHVSPARSAGSRLRLLGAKRHRGILLGLPACRNPCACLAVLSEAVWIEYQAPV